jgi:branched-chain amino acid transport system substrate-binding protein
MSDAVKRLISAFVALLLLSLTAQAQEVKPLKVGVIGPFTGPSADFGVPMLNGIKLATDEINAIGGYMGRKLELVIKDDQANPDLGLRLSQELVKEGVVATLGFCNTGVALKSLEVFQTSQTPLIIPCSTGSPLTRKYPAEKSYIFRTSASDSIQAPFVVADLVKRGLTKVAILADTSGYGEAGLKDVSEALLLHGLKPVHVGRFALGVNDLTDQLKQAKAAGANVVFSYTVGPENAVIAKGRKALDWKVPQAGAWPLSFPFYLEGAGAAADGSLMSQTFIAEPTNERRRAFLSAYLTKHAQLPRVPMAAAQGYDSVYILMHSLIAVRDGKLSGPVVKFALENLTRTYYGVVTTYNKPFSAADKEAMSDNMLVMGVVKNGAITFAYAQDAKNSLTVQRKRQ